jgi:hypothetical protein
MREMIETLLEIDAVVNKRPFLESKLV